MLKVAQRIAEGAPATLTPAPRMRVDVPQMVNWVAGGSAAADTAHEQEAYEAKQRRFRERSIP